jgi:hypothetical protein
LYLPNGDISADESLTHWKGHLSSNSAYLWKHWNLESRLTSCVMLSLGTSGPFTYMQAMKQNFTPPWSQPTSTKQQSLFWNWCSLYWNGQTVWTDNFYNSFCVTKMLKTVHKTDHVSKLKLNQKNVSKKVKETELKKVK